MVVMGDDMIRQLHVGLRDLQHHGSLCGLDHILGCCRAGSRLVSVPFTSGHVAFLHLFERFQAAGVPAAHLSRRLCPPDCSITAADL
jgi:hypothetical protein